MRISGTNVVDGVICDYHVDKMKQEKDDNESESMG